MTKLSSEDAFGPPPVSGSDRWFRMKDIDSYATKAATLRVLEVPGAFGMERWSAPTKEAPAGKPVRWRIGEPEPKIEWKPGEGQGAKRFWAFWVYEHASGKIKAWSFTQKQVYELIKKLYESPKWGDLTTYDIEVGRTGTGLDTEYSVISSPKEPLPAAVLKEWAELKETATGLEALFDGGDPFAPFGSAAAKPGDGDIPL